jgi:hypothetical protein
MLIGPIFVKMTGGSIETGKWTGKMIVLESLWDREALAWQADWYRGQVRSNLGDKADQNFRVWFSDHAVHGDADPKNSDEDPSRVISYLPALQQALRDVSAWVEKGVAPPQSTHYQIVDGQVRIPAGAAERKGIQPVVALKVNGGQRAVIKAGQSVALSGTITVPPGAGFVTAADWDFDGRGTFAEKASTPLHSRAVSVTTTHRFETRGTYFVALRGFSQRQGDRSTPYAQIQNLDRVRVIVE